MSNPDPAIVDDPKNLTPEWLTNVLRSAGHDVRVRQCRSESVGTGQMAHNERIFLEYEGDRDDAPSTLVGKFPSPRPESRASGAAGGYPTEMRFYTGVAERLSIRVPACYYGAISEDDSSFVLLLEDMAPAVQGDQIDGASTDQIEASVENLAGLHAPFWGDPELDEILGGEERLAAEFVPVIQMATPAFIERYQEQLDPEEQDVLRGFAEGFARWIETEPMPRTLVHGDFRLDNQLFATTENGPRVTTVDWQTISTGNGGRDLAYLLGNGCSPAARREMESEVLETYRRVMGERGVELSAEAVHHAYRHGSFQGPLITMLGALGVGQTERGDAMFMAMAKRSVAQIRDLEALDLIS